jgi:hypothetical protein
MRPKIIIKPTRADNILETGGIILLSLMWVSTLLIFLQAPGIVPIHFDLAGNADGYGSKGTILFLPVIPTVLYVGLSQLSKYPHILNYMQEITPENAREQYTIATRMLLYLKLAILLIFTLIVLFTYLTSLGLADGPGPWFLPLIIGLIITPTIFGISRSLKKRNK